MPAKTKAVSYEIGGLMRCCLQSIPTVSETDRTVVAGKFDGERIPCQYCKDDGKSGVRFVNGRWRAAWIDHDKA